MIRNLSKPTVILTLKPSVQTLRTAGQLADLTTALNGLGQHAINFDNEPKPTGGYEVRIFSHGCEERVRTIAGNHGFIVTHRRSL